MKTLSHVLAAVTTSIWERMALTAMGIAYVVAGCVAGSLFLLACGTVMLAGQLVMLASDRTMARIDAPSPISRSLADALRADYLADRLDTISFLARLEALYTARKSEITDWDSVGWDSPLCPMKGRWVWEDDQLIAASADPPGRSYFHDLTTAQDSNGRPVWTADLIYRVTKAAREGTLTPDTAREYLGYTPIRPPSTMDPQRGDHSRCQCLPGPQNHILLTIAEREAVLESWSRGLEYAVWIPGDPGPTIFGVPDRKMPMSERRD